MPYTFGGGGGGGALPQITLTQSQTWVPPQDGNICIHVIGGGGAGFTNTINGAMRSGGAAGYCKKNSLAVTTSGSFTIVVGVGGYRDEGGSTAQHGGNSTVAGTGLSATLTSNGGGRAEGGAHGTGGSAANGDVNNTGGAGNDGGGGAVGIYGTGASGTSANIGGGQSDASAGGINGGGLDMSGYGYIVGGDAGSSIGHYNNASLSPNGGALSGGGGAFQLGTWDKVYVYGGNGGIGAGGGGALASSTNRAFSGKGGDGVVLIQYLP